MSKLAILLTAPRKTGKDTLVDKILFSSNEYKWKIYSRQDNTQLDLPQDLVHIAFAKKLKRDCSKIYNIPENISDEDKDIKQFIHYITGELVSARDIYIEYGKLKRLEDIDYWCAAAVSDNLDDNIIITDWRFPNELDYISSKYRVVTVRLYRSNVIEADFTVESEHSLDLFPVDFVLVPENDWELCINRHPIFTHYTFTGYYI